MSDNQFGNFSDLIFKKLKVFHFAVTFFHSVCQIIPTLEFQKIKFMVLFVRHYGFMCPVICVGGVEQ